MRSSQLEQERAEYRASIVEALEEDEDPLAAYDDFIKWTSRAGSDDPHSGLVQLLEEATRKFKDDARYSGDLRYLKIWCSYAKVVEKPSVVYAYLVKREIGCVYALLWEEYAITLEKEGRHTEADNAFRAGISRSARPIERLKKRYRDFQARPASSKSRLPPFKPCGIAEVDALRRNPFKNHDPQPSSTASQTTQSTSAPSGSASGSGSTHARYAPMLAPPAPGRRPEKLRFNLSLLFTPSGVEYSAAEVRARSMGLLGKKWGPPAASELRDSSAGVVRVNFNDDGSRSTQNMGATASGGRRKSAIIAAGEPTVTINTKEALADVFGMYNSPDKTVKRAMPGSKHAPVRKIEPIGSRRMESLGSRRVELAHPPSENENAKTPAFKPFVDENAGRKERPVAPQKFKPLVEEPKQPSAIPPTQGRRALSLKDSSIPSDAATPPVFAANPKASPPNPLKPTFLKPTPEEPENKPVFSKPFTPVSQKEPLVRPSNIKPSPDAVASQAQGQVKQPFAPFVDAKTPFKVFSRPPNQGQGENGGLSGLGGGSVFTPKPPSAPTPSVGATPVSGAFRPFIDDENAAQSVASQTPSSTRRVNALQPRPVPIPPTIEETYTDESSLGEGAEDRYEEREPEIDGHAFSSSSSHTNFSESEDGYAFEGEEPEAGVVSSSDSQNDEEDGEQHVYIPEHAQEAVFKDDGDFYADDDEGYREPLGGRFGKIDVMTPITERTFEFSTRGLPTPTSTTRWQEREWREREGRESGKYALEVAQKLAREVQEDAEEGEYQEYEVEGSHAILAGHPQSGAGFADQSDLGVIEERTGTLSLSDSLAVVAAFRPPNPCVPTDPAIISTLLSLLPADGDFYDLRAKDGGMLDGLQHFAAKKARGSKGGNVEDGILVTLEERKLRVIDKLGEGGFGTVFAARDVSKSVADDDEDLDLEDDDDDDEATMLALKIVKPRNLWEFHVLRRVHRTLPTPLARSIVSPLALYAFRDESHLLLELCQHGTLLDIVNRAGPAGVSQQGACLDELLVFFYMIELIKFVEGMHTAGFIHGDLKIDNCLLRIEELPGGASSLSAMYQPSGEGGWKYRGVKVIDFGRTIDTTLFPAGHSQQFIADWPTDDRDCLEIRQNRPWTYQTDYFGLAGIVYCMLFGKYMESSSVVLAPGSSESDPVYKIATPFKRYWQSGILTDLFDLLLNPCRVHPDGSLPICEELAALRTEMEAWLQSNCNRSSNTLKGLLKKIELSAYTR
ncbi:Mad3/BUB1 homology region 1-domain-containing protein [Scleroderma yunnanense]